MRLSFLLLLCGLCLPLPAGAEARWFVDFEQTGPDLDQTAMAGWHLPLPQDWEIATDGANRVLRLAKSGPIGNPRRPVKFALWKAGCVSDFVSEVKMRRNDGSLLMAFGFQDRAHFYYAHVSRDDGDTRVHNGLFKVSGGERYRIGGAGSAPVLPTTRWHTVKVVRKAESGSIEVFVDGETEARFAVTDTSFQYGWVGLGSFDETGDFDDFRLTGTSSHHCEPAKLDPLDSE